MMRDGGIERQEAASERKVPHGPGRFMVQTCDKCKRSNPPEAAFCYFDGSALPGAAHLGRARYATHRRFPSPFVFPRGRACGTFDELAVACQEDWPAARELLQQGYFETFLNGLGRADLR